ncbi:YaaA family protein [Candidatus Rickettsia colombianensi]|uniref:YaaA family protein n=1 Tax=Candidatus Rickettsia colombianensi TaxID=1090944 RepID=UPI000EF24C81|nr:YaaA family protein [Candidatus Rickettsia colombianensi]
MLVIISSAKTLNFEKLAPKTGLTSRIFPNLTNQLLSTLQNYSENQLSKVMNISAKLAHINKERFKDFDNQESKAAIFAYAGDVFNNIHAEKLTNHEINFLQSHLLIISGLYGALKPLDAIKPYRLEMATKLNEINLTSFWQDEVTNYINKILAKHENKYLLNLASQEYSSVINPNKLKYQLVNVHFKENRNGKLSTIGINAKKARGNMVNVIANNLIDSPELLKNFSYLDYEFSTKHSSDNELVFIKSFS